MTTPSRLVSPSAWGRLRKRVNAELRTQGEPELSAAERAWVELEHDPDDPDVYELVQGLVRHRRRQPVDEPQSRTPTDLAAFTWSRSLLRAAEAENEPEVQRFRADVLNDELLTLDDVGGWVARQQKVDGPATYTVHAAAPAGWQPGDPIDDVERVRSRVDELVYPSDGWPVSVPVNRSGVLGYLQVLSKGLAGYFGWQPAQAVVFVLTGAVPVVSMLRVTTRVGTNQRVVLDVDPDVPAAVVADAHQTARRTLLGSKPRQPSQRAVELVTFAADHPQLDAGRLWRRWNHTHDEADQFVSVRALRQALTDARRRVDGRPRSARVS